jgi:molybdate/tungstate transport system substrate-binding protein
MKIRFIIYLFITSLILSISCKPENKEKLIIFHAGSLSAVFYDIAEDFKKEYPEIDVFMEQSGSLAAARKVTDLNKTCDILALADNLIIDNMLYDKYTDWGYIFASNEMIIAYNDKSKYANEINSENWKEIILREDVIIGRSEPNLDPCGYRTLFLFDLAEKHYTTDELALNLKNKKETVIRPKETDLIAILETNNIDYLFIYKSVAIHHNLNYISLPDEINLSNPEMENVYNTVSTEVDGAKQGDKIILNGSSIVYGFCIPKNHQNYEYAIKMCEFILNKEKGGKIINEGGLKYIKTYNPKYKNNIPKELLIPIAEKE